MIRRVLVDFDILLDVLLDREPYVEYSVKLWELIESGQIEGYVTLTTLNKIFDIGREKGDIEIAWQALSEIRAIMNICPIDDQILAKASSYKIEDFEFAIQLACASVLNLDYILSRKKGNLQIFYNLDFKYISENIFSLVPVKQFLDSYCLFDNPTHYITRYVKEEEKRLYFVDFILKNVHQIIANCAKDLLIEQKLIDSNDQAHIKSYIETIQRDMANILKYIMYVILSYDTSVFDKLRLDCLDRKETSQSLNLNHESVIFLIYRMQDNILKITNESTDIDHVDCISLIYELNSYFEKLITVIN
ncbi:hypothetical protein H6G80_04975 [Nostoc sp. FACHB-87]|uniref:PIN domain-containing protein n=1 Tax=Nostocaceae TaxID=1162 RepID=UPI001684BF97|nr:MULTISPECIES: PIN domain-containing protein [Nostocaceae]MBD2301481.1 hypothetical protein [Nostoc sp. FACHB-190]MBD2453425.1 hypothetical protein [Nostoc sp. FACHB-87]MBD2475550.1 hypothetical protein [Anabaena sp. FACHB-83]